MLLHPGHFSLSSVNGFKPLERKFVKKLLSVSLGTNHEVVLCQGHEIYVFWEVHTTYGTRRNFSLRLELFPMWRCDPGLSIGLLYLAEETVNSPQLRFKEKIMTVNAEKMDYFTN